MSRATDPNLKDMLSRLTAAGTSSSSIFGPLLAHVNDGIAFAELEGGAFYVNEAGLRLLGFATGAAFVDVRAHGAHLYYLNEFSPLAEHELPLVRALRGEETDSVELFVRHPMLDDGGLISMSAQPLRRSDGHVVGGLAVFQDIGARKRAEEELRAANQKLATWVTELERRAFVSLLMNDMADLLQSCVSVDECYEVVARFCARIFQEEPGAVYVVNASRTAIERIAAWGSAESTGRVYAPNACWALRRGRLHRAGGERLGPDCAHVSSPVDGEYLCIPMMGQGEALGIVHVRQPAIPSAIQTELGPMITEFRLRTVIAVSEHIALALANLRLRETLRMQAIRDPLTDLFNRRYMEESLRREIARAVHARGSVAAIMIDIDHFKRFNDTFGHPAADVALRETCSLISASGRGDEIACRWGGEEFVLILPDANLNDAKARAEELRQSISNHQVRYNGTLLGVVTASFGVAEFPSHAKTGEDLIRAADEALYEAKASGRNCVRCK